MKRFTETEKWNDSWFMALTANQKLAWIYLTDRCDSCGVWDRNDRLANCQIGSQVNWDEALLAFGKGRVRVLPNGKWFIQNFAKFQCGKLNPASIPHKKVIEKGEAHGLSLTDGILTTPPTRVGTTLQEEEGEEEKEKDKEGKGSGETKSDEVSKCIDFELVREQGGNANASKRPTLETLLLQGAKTGLPESEVHKFFNFYESKGWMVGKNPMKSYKHAMSGWKLNWQERNANANKGTDKPNPRNIGIAADPTYSDKLAAKVRAMQGNPQPVQDGMAAQVADAGCNGTGSAAHG